ncbi:MAG TPA: trypsin-like peptidase domain-containing protein, partial [Naasia sp.]
AAAAAAPGDRKRHITLPVIAALAVGALLGGAAGGGIAVLAGAGADNGSSNSSSVSPNITVNRAESATDVTAVAAQASPAVVTISVSGGNGGGSGSGVILSEDGYVLTNTHVVTLDGSAADPEIRVTLADGRIFDATIVGLDPVVDLAVIQLEGASGLPTIEWGDSSELNVGDTAIAIGSPLGLSGTVTDGIVSALNRSITVASSAIPDDSPEGEDPGDQGDGQSPFDFWNFDIPGQQPPSGGGSSISLPVIQTDAAINPGNSGGALLNASGELIGINVAIASAGSSGGGQSGNIGVGFAVPSNLAQRVADEIIANGSASHGLLGATVADAITAAEDAGIAGAYIDEVTPGGAAAAAGLQSGDIITGFNGIAVTSRTDLTAQVRFLAAGAEAELTFVRNGDEQTTSVTLGQLEL